MKRSAVISPCEKYRYRLDRTIDDPLGGLVIAFFGINPSTADASVDDQTIRKLHHFARHNNASRFIVGNVFAYRATHVHQLATPGIDPLGPDRNAHLQQIISEAHMLVPMWGDRGKVLRRLHGHIDTLADQLRAHPFALCFGKTLSGDPKHPLMLPYSTPLVAFA